MSININVEDNKDDIVNLLYKVIEQVNDIGYGVSTATLDRQYIYCSGHGIVGDLLMKESEEGINVRPEIREKYIILGGSAAIEHKAKFEEETLYVANDGVHFESKFYGMYGCFTVMTQHTYGTEEDLLFVLGVMSTHKDKMETDTHEFYKTMTKARESFHELAAKDTLKEMKRIGKLEGVRVVARNYVEAYDMYFKPYNHSGKFMGENYFYHYRMGRVLFHECEFIVKEE